VRFEWVGKRRCDQTGGLPCPLTPERGFLTIAYEIDCPLGSLQYFSSEGVHTFKNESQPILPSRPLSLPGGHVECLVQDDLPSSHFVNAKTQF
jgi:hypothetical protein